MLRMKSNIQKPLKDVGQQWENTKGMEKCKPKVQPKSHIHTLGNVRKCEGMSSHTPKWIPYKISNVQKTILKVKTHWIEKFFTPLQIFWYLNV